MNKGIILIAIALCACNNPGQASKENMQVDSNVETVMQQRKRPRMRRQAEPEIKIDPQFATRFRSLTFAQALDSAKAEGKRVFINFHTQNCGPCRMMEQRVFPQKECGDYFNANYVCLSMDAETGEAVELARKNNVGIYPTYVIFETDGTALCSVVGATKDKTQFLDKVKAAVAAAENTGYVDKK